MTGPEHYREAERLLNRAVLDDHGTVDSEEQGTIVVALVHATLALAAATAITSYQAAEDWETAAGQGKP